MTDVILRASGLAKRFGATVALDDVGLELRRGEMLALVGANGAGKSTLVKIVCGAVAADRGTLEIAGTPVHFRGVADAMAAGIAVAHQQVALGPGIAAEDLETAFVRSLSADRVHRGALGRAGRADHRLVYRR